MAMPTNVPIIDCMIGFPAQDFSQYEFIRKQLRDPESRDGFDFPVEYMFKHVPKELYGSENPIDITLHEMDRFNVERGLIGVGVIMGPEAVSGFNPANLAQLAIMGAALSYAFASVWGRVMLAGQPPLMNALGMVTASALIMAPVVWMVDGAPVLGLTATTWGALLGLAALSTALAYVLYFAILVRAGAANLMLVTLLIPPFAIGLGAMFLGERIGPEAWIGFAIIAVGFAVNDGRVFGSRSR